MPQFFYIYIKRNLSMNDTIIVLGDFLNNIEKKSTIRLELKYKSWNGYYFNG